MPFHNSIMGNFMVYQDRLETNLFQLFKHTQNSEWFYTIYAIIFEVNIVDEQEQTYLTTIFLFFISFNCPQLIGVGAGKFLGVRRIFPKFP